MLTHTDDASDLNDVIKYAFEYFKSRCFAWDCVNRFRISVSNEFE